MTFPSWMRDLGKVYREQDTALFVEAPLSNLEKVMKKIRSHRIGVVNAITGVDTGKEIELLYHFVHAGQVLTVKFRVSRKKPEVPSVVETFPSGLIFEQETHEMLGILFHGNPRLKNVLLSEASPREPLRKEDANKPREEKR